MWSWRNSRWHRPGPVVDINHFRAASDTSDMFRTRGGRGRGSHRRSERNRDTRDTERNRMYTVQDFPPPSEFYYVLFCTVQILKSLSFWFTLWEKRNNPVFSTSHVFVSNVPVRSVNLEAHPRIKIIFELTKLNLYCRLVSTLFDSLNISAVDTPVVEGCNYMTI